MATFRPARSATVVFAALMLGAAACASSNTNEPAAGDGQHVLLLSIDGVHQSDLTDYVQAHPDSALAGIVSRGISYTNAQTPFPSDSFPGLLAQLTGGNPRTTGVYYDDSYAHDLLAQRCPKVSPCLTNSIPKASSWSPTGWSGKQASTRCCTASSSHR